MTDKERAEEHALLYCAKNCTRNKCATRKTCERYKARYRSFLAGLAEGRAELEIREKLIKYWKKKCKDKSNDVIELQKENAELKEQNKDLCESLDIMNNRESELLKQIEKMKCCPNCKKERNKPEPLAVHVSCAKCKDYSEWELAE